LSRTPEERRRRHVRDAIGLVVSAVSIAAVAWWASKQQRPTFPESAGDFALLLVAVLLYGVATLVRGWRWHEILRRAHIDHRKTDAFALTAVGYMGNTVLPARGGELLRILLLGQRTSARRREVLGSIIAERVLDAIALVILFVSLTWARVGGSPAGQRPAWIAVAAGVALVTVLAGYIALRRRGRFERFAIAVRPVARASRLLFWRLGLALLLVTIGVWFVEGTILWLIGQSLNLDLTLIEATFVVVFTSFFLLIPAGPGYIGTFDGALAVALHALKIKGGGAVAFILLARFVLFVPVTIAGAVLMITRYGGLRLRLRRRRPASQLG
jgi:glycosyltransferase 2 family protein